MWLKKYLQFGGERPLWASLADFLIEEDIPRSSSINKELTINIFFQEWGPYMSQKSKLQMDIKRMLHVVEKYNVQVDASQYQLKYKGISWHGRLCT